MQKLAYAILAALLLAPPLAAQQRTIAITIDDLPAPEKLDDLKHLQAINRDLLKTLVAERVPAIGFVNEEKLLRTGEVDERIAVMREWLAAGMELGNHTYSHKGLTRAPLAQWEDDVIKGEAITRKMMAAEKKMLRYFRHPFTQRGATEEVRSAAAEFLRSRGYLEAPFTVEHSDWVFARVYLQLLEKADAARAQQLRREYVEYLGTMLEFYEGLSRETFGRELAQILLIHVNRLNADVLPEMLAVLKTRGYRVVSLDEALADPAYKTEDGYVGKWGPSWLHRWRIALKQPDRWKDEPEPPKWITEIYNAATR